MHREMHTGQTFPNACLLVLPQRLPSELLPGTTLIDDDRWSAAACLFIDLDWDLEWHHKQNLFACGVSAKVSPSPGCFSFYGILHCLLPVTATTVHQAQHYRSRWSPQTLIEKRLCEVDISIYDMSKHKAVNSKVNKTRWFLDFNVELSRCPRCPLRLLPNKHFVLVPRWQRSLQGSAPAIRVRLPQRFSKIDKRYLSAFAHFFW